MYVILGFFFNFFGILFNSLVLLSVLKKIPSMSDIITFKPNVCLDFSKKCILFYLKNINDVRNKSPIC